MALKASLLALYAAALATASPLQHRAVDELNLEATQEAHPRDETATRAFSNVQIKTSDGKCLFVDKLSGDFRANLTPVQIAECGSTDGQGWDVLTSGKHNNQEGTMLVVSTLTQACLNFDPRRQPGNQLLLFSCGGRANGEGEVTNSQLFPFAGAGPLTLSPLNDNNICATASGQTLDVANCAGAENQLFTFGNGAAANPGGNGEVANPGGNGEVANPGGNGEVANPGENGEVANPGGNGEVANPVGNNTDANQPVNGGTRNKVWGKGRGRGKGHGKNRYQYLPPAPPAPPASGAPPAGTDAGEAATTTPASAAAPTSIAGEDATVTTPLSPAPTTAEEVDGAPSTVVESATSAAGNEGNATDAPPTTTAAGAGSGGAVPTANPTVPVPVSRAGGTLNPSAAAEAHEFDKTAVRAKQSVNIRAADGRCLSVDPTAGDFRQNLIPVAMVECADVKSQKFDLVTSGLHNQGTQGKTLLVSVITDGCIGFDPRREEGDKVIVFSCGGRANGEGKTDSAQLYPFDGSNTIVLQPDSGRGTSCLVAGAERLDAGTCDQGDDQKYELVEVL